jgi:hypothetical protein
MYALQTGLTTLVNILSRLGLVALKSAQAAFELLIGSASCLASWNQGFSAMLGACFNADQLSKVFGPVLGILLAAVVAVTSVVQYFRSAFDDIKDLIGGKDNYNIVIAHSATPSCSAQALAVAAHAYLVAQGQVSGTNDVNAHACDQGYAEIIFTGSPGGGPSYQATMAFKAVSGAWQWIGGADYIPPGSFGMPVSVGQALVNALQPNAGGDEHVTF